VTFGTTTTMVRLRPEEEDRGVVMVLLLTIWDDPPITFVRVMANEAGHDDAAGQAQSCCWERVESEGRLLLVVWVEREIVLRWWRVVPLMGILVLVVVFVAAVVSVVWEKESSARERNRGYCCDSQRCSWDWR
jgi:hypothetical protein